MTFAVFQNRASVARASGLAAIPLRISVALIFRSRDQSVLLPCCERFAFDPLDFMTGANPELHPHRVRLAPILQRGRSCLRRISARNSDAGRVRTATTSS
jgi:hypothetical protein